MCYWFVTAENKQPADFGMLPDNSGSADLNEKLLLQHGNPALVSLKVRRQVSNICTLQHCLQAKCPKHQLFLYVCTAAKDYDCT